MWIRTQNRKSLIKPLVEIWVSGVIVWAESNTNSFEIGRYETEERAIEVLDEIQRFINEFEFAVATDQECSKVFQMPKE